LKSLTLFTMEYALKLLNSNLYVTQTHLICNTNSPNILDNLNTRESHCLEKLDIIYNGACFKVTQLYNLYVGLNSYMVS